VSQGWTESHLDTVEHSVLSTVSQTNFVESHAGARWARSWVPVRTQYETLSTGGSRPLEQMSKANTQTSVMASPPIPQAMMMSLKRPEAPTAGALNGLATNVLPPVRPTKRARTAKRWESVLENEDANEGEIHLYACCEQEKFPGALDPAEIYWFVETLLFQCGDTASRLLAIEILNSTHDWDEQRIQEWVARTDDKPKMPPTRYIRLFLEASGMFILSLWLSEASAVKNGKVSEIGGTLIELLRLLKRIPFQKDYVTESKINKEIRNLSKKVDAGVKQRESQPNGKVVNWNDDAAGGNDLRIVQRTLNDVKTTWQKRASSDGFVDSGVIVSKMKTNKNHGGRLPAVREYISPIPSKPVVKPVPAKKETEQASTAELAKLEREKEKKNQQMLSDLEVTKKKRQELLKQLDAKRELYHRPVIQRRPVRRVRWKDGQGSASGIRIRDQLEQVFTFVCEKKKRKPVPKPQPSRELRAY